MGDHYTERYRRGQTWRAYENVREDDDLGDPWDEARRNRGDTRSHTGYPYGGDRGAWQGSNLRYGLNGGDSTEPDDTYLRQREYRRRYASEAGDYGDYGDVGDGSHRQARRYGRDDTGARGYESRYGSGYERRYDEEPGFGQRRWSQHRDDERDDDDRNRRHGMLYNLGHRIGEAVSDWFGSDTTKKRTGPRGFTRTDERIRDQICEQLAFGTGIDVSDVSVDVDKGKVTLAGSVRLRSQKYDIEDIADNTFGVTEVENNIRVQRGDVASSH
ncbi:BON domain-containing protein [Cupriavidus sp. YR651]|uniref:BON domain-containing protein n=1 Tax=Cupriavidus sp. YR651 TaxID=1855315 RepID=UPI00088AFBCB|nr:BON domain-containing protein [Cupriavidus sp. YR651]SDC91427.1 BON domain-containing protein [Cupriavidus sp. YR651]